jgi:hypothetical protein
VSSDDERQPAHVFIEVSIVFSTSAVHVPPFGGLNPKP